MTNESRYVEYPDVSTAFYAGLKEGKELGREEGAASEKEKSLPWCFVHEFDSSDICKKCGVRVACKERTEVLRAEGAMQETGAGA